MTDRTPETPSRWSRRALFTGGGVASISAAGAAIAGPAAADGPHWPGMTVNTATLLDKGSTWGPSERVALLVVRIAPGTPRAEFIVEPAEKDTVWTMWVVPPSGVQNYGKKLPDGRLQAIFNDPVPGEYALMVELYWTPNRDQSGTVTFGATDNRATVLADFSDVKPGTKYHGAVRKLLDKWVVFGGDAATFVPGATLLRGDAAAWLQRGAGHYMHERSWYAGTSYVEPEFSDVPKRHEHYRAILWAKRNGVINGYTDETFRPDHPMTRGEFVTVFARAFPRMGYTPGTEGVEVPPLPPRSPLPPVSPPFKDVTETTMGYGAIEWARKSSLVAGYKDGTFRPKEQITRGEAATILSRLV